MPQNNYGKDFNEFGPRMECERKEKSFQVEETGERKVCTQKIAKCEGGVTELGNPNGNGEILGACFQLVALIMTFIAIFIFFLKRGAFISNCH